jgi:peptidoglycan-associated lipoprotein
MKATRFGTLIALGTALSFIAVGCQLQNPRKIPPNQISAPEVPNMPPLPPPGPQMPITDVNSTNVPFLNEFPGHTNWIENAEQLKDDTVHFAFDSSAIRSSDKSKVAAVADYLKQNPEAAVRVEGNCDERGTEEYNRSLGERRALAAREELVRLGILSDRVDTLSYGEDKPLDSGHNESAWKQNRRDDFILLTPPK